MLRIDKVGLFSTLVIMLFCMRIQAQELGDSTILGYNETKQLALEIVERPDIPDGFEGLLAYGGGWIHLIDLKNKQEIVYSGLPLMYNPSISSDGSMIAFGTDHIFLLEIRTGVVRRISPELIEGGGDSHSGRYPHFSHDGRYIIYSTYLNRRDFANHPRLYDVQESLPLTFDVGLPPETEIWEPRWSPDGQQISFFAKAGFRQPTLIYSIDSTCISTPPCTPTLVQSNLNLPRSLLWFPDSRHIGYVDLSPANPDGSFNPFFRLYGFEIGSNQSETVLAGDFDLDFPAWSPDGNYLAFGLWNMDGTNYLEGIYAVPVGGSAEDRILLISASGSRNMVWASGSIDISAIEFGD